MNIQDVDIQLVLHRLRPGSAYHWKGAGQFGNTMEAIGEWRDPATQPPTEAEILAEWGRCLEEATAAAALRQQVRSLAASAVGVNIRDLTAAQVKALFAIWLYSVGAINNVGEVRPLAQWVLEMNDGGEA